MQRIAFMSGRVVIFLGLLLVARPLRADDAPPAPPPTTAPVTASLGGDGRLTYVPPADWELVPSASNDKTAAYLSPDHLGILALQLLPTNAVVDATAGPSIVRQLRQNHQKASQKMLLEPTIESDPHFALVIHERYLNSDGNECDEMHLYKRTGPLNTMLTVNAMTDDADLAKKTHGIGKAVLLSAKFVRPHRS